MRAMQNLNLSQLNSNLPGESNDIAFVNQPSNDTEGTLLNNNT